MDLLRDKFFWLVFSLVVIMPGLVFIFLGGLKLGLDFTGGSLLEVRFVEAVAKLDLENLGVVTPTGEDSYILRTKVFEGGDLEEFKGKLKSRFGDFELLRAESIGPVVGEETKRKAFVAVGVASVAILAYITFAFRKVPKPASSLRFGVATIVALLHDVLVVLGVFAILGFFAGVEIDSLFITAVLTIMGFSVHDTIVVFDRVRENLKKMPGPRFSEVINASVNQTLARSLNTSITVVLVLFALLVFGGVSIRWFVIALLVGVVSGTYSSIFNASVVLAWWEEKLGH